MDQEIITLINFFGLEKKHYDESKAGIEATNTFRSLKEVLRKEAKDIPWPFAYDTIINKIDGLLNISLTDIMFAAWRKYGTLLKYCDKEKYKPDESLFEPLAEHTITSSHKPYIEVLVHDQSVGRIDFTVYLSLILKGFILEIQDGKIMEIQTGSCQGTGEIKCEEFPILEKKTQPYPIPGVIHLGKGIPIIP